MTTLPRAPLQAERVPFPVEARYQIRPDLQKLEPGGLRFVLDEAWSRYLARKLELLSSNPGQCRVIDGDEGPIFAGLWQVAQIFADEHPQHCLVDERGAVFPELGLGLGRDGALFECGEPFAPALAARIVHHLEPLTPTARLADALALAVQEDLVLVAGPPDRDSATLLHVCFPSHWNPAERAGASFAQLHAPVPHNGRLLAGARNMLAAMLAKGPFIRHVWSLTRSADLDQNPARPHVGDQVPGSLLDRLHFRAERQTTTPLVGLALFTIRIYVTPLRQMLDPQRAGLLARAIRSMDEDLLRYKSLIDIREPLLEELDEFAER